VLSAAQLLGENTLTIADTLVLAPDENGNLALMFRRARRCRCITCVALFLNVYA